MEVEEEEEKIEVEVEEDEGAGVEIGKKNIGWSPRRLLVSFAKEGERSENREKFELEKVFSLSGDGAEVEFEIGFWKEGE